MIREDNIRAILEPHFTEFKEKKMNDNISRQAAIDALEKEKPTPFVDKDGNIDPFGAGRQNQWYRDGIAIMSLPSAQTDQTAINELNSLPEQSGYWINDGYYGDNHPQVAYRCSNCDEQYIGYPGEFKYCPNCGMKMVNRDG